jgi:hypothetical protein
MDELNRRLVQKNNNQSTLRQMAEKAGMKTASIAKAVTSSCSTVLRPVYEDVTDSLGPLYCIVHPRTHWLGLEDQQDDHCEHQS